MGNRLWKHSKGSGHGQASAGTTTSIPRPVPGHMPSYALHLLPCLCAHRLPGHVTTDSSFKCLQDCLFQQRQPDVIRELAGIHWGLTAHTLARQLVLLRVV